MPEISIVDTKNIIRAIKLKYGRDLGVFPVSLIRYKLDRIIKLNFSKYADILITRLIEDSSFYNHFIHELYTSDIELFRDPEFWKKLHFTIIPELFSELETIEICLPDCNNSFELYSLLIMLEENEILKYSNILISYSSVTTPQKIFSEIKGMRLKDIGLENFQIVFPETKIEKYFQLKDGKYYFKKEKLQKVQSILLNSETYEFDQKFNFIFFRDHLINYNSQIQEKILERLIKNLEKKGIVLFGYRESVSEFFKAKNNFIAFDEQNRIYQKFI